ncbi:MAG: hypothetical protein AB7O44_20590 [Hyphomicrobiaceae bacterium]
MTDAWKRPDGHPLTVERAKELLAGDLGNEYRAILSRCCAPIYWHQRKDGAAQILNSGTMTFLQTPKRLVGVTAAHVVLGYQQEHANAASPLHLQIMNAFLNLEVIGLSKALDIATVAMDDTTLGRIGKEIVPLSTWPPQPPQEGRGIMLAGYPGVDRLQPGSMEVNWGLFTALGIARRVIGEQITWVPERQHDGVITDLPPKHRLGGISGGPLIGWFESASHLVHYALSGVISQAHPELENVIARRADFIQEDGTIAEPRHYRWREEDSAAGAG